MSSENPNFYICRSIYKLLVKPLHQEGFTYFNWFYYLLLFLPTNWFYYMFPVYWLIRFIFYRSKLWILHIFSGKGKQNVRQRSNHNKVRPHVLMCTTRFRFLIACVILRGFWESTYMSRRSRPKIYFGIHWSLLFSSLRKLI